MPPSVGGIGNGEGRGGKDYWSRLAWPVGGNRQRLRDALVPCCAANHSLAGTVLGCLYAETLPESEGACIAVVRKLLLLRKYSVIAI